MCSEYNLAEKTKIILIIVLIIDPINRPHVEPAVCACSVNTHSVTLISYQIFSYHIISHHYHSISHHHNHNHNDMICTRSNEGFWFEIIYCFSHSTTCRYLLCYVVLWYGVCVWCDGCGGVARCVVLWLMCVMMMVVYGAMVMVWCGVWCYRYLQLTDNTRKNRNNNGK